MGGMGGMCGMGGGMPMGGMGGGMPMGGGMGGDMSGMSGMEWAAQGRDADSIHVGIGHGRDADGRRREAKTL